MSTELLERERLHRQANAELEQRARQLLQLDLSVSTAPVASTVASSPPAPAAVPTAAAQFYKCRADALQNELDALKTKYNSKSNQIKQFQREHEKLLTENNKWKRKTEINKEQKEKLQHQISILQANVQEKECQVSSLKQENESIKKELKSSSVSTTGQEAQLNRALAEVQRLQEAAAQARKADKELRDTHRREVTRLATLNAALHKQTSELTSAFNKQLLLIDNLKKQKAQLEAAGAVRTAGEELERLLEWPGARDSHPKHKTPVDNKV